MSVVRVGSSENFANNWDRIFGGGKSATKKSSAKSAPKSAKKSAAAGKKKVSTKGKKKK